ncbi:MAG: hypothetical protein ABH831_01895 [Candidatus Nealsonbacteria bacterium]
MIVRNFWFFLVGIFFVFDLMATIGVFRGGYGLAEKATCLIVLVFLFFWLMHRSIGFFSDIMVPKALRGRKIFVEQNGGGYDMMRIVDILNSYFSEQGAIIADDSGAAEFQLILSPSLIEPEAINCRLSDQQGYERNLKEYGFNWPKSLAMAVATFIRTSDRRSVE